MSSEMQFRVTVSVDGYGRIPGAFQKSSGGEAESKPQKSFDGGMGPERVYPSRKTFTDYTVSRINDNEYRHDLPVIAALRDNHVGNSMATIVEQALDAQGNAFGTPRTMRGMLATLADGPTDANSDAPREWTMTFAVTTSSN